MLKNQNGITLVALVVTIVILIILATISISVAVQGGLIGKAQDAAGLYTNQQDKFNEFEANTVDFIQGYLNQAAPAVE